MTPEEHRTLDEVKKVAMANIVPCDCFVLVAVVDGDVRLIRGVKDGFQKLAMVGSLALAIATMNGETLAEGGVSFVSEGARLN